MDNRLFHKAPLADLLDAQVEKMKAYLGDLAPERLDAASDDEITAHVVSEYRVDPLTVYSDRATAEHAETAEDVSHHFSGHEFDRSRPCLVKGNQITLYVPFAGDPELLLFTPRTCTLPWPKGSVRKESDVGGTIVTTLALPGDLDETQFNRWIAEQLGGLKQNAEWSRCEVEAYNDRLEPQVRSAIATRRRQLEKQGSLLQKLAVPLRPRADAPNPAPVPIRKRLVKPLPAPRKVEQEYWISDQHYEYILNILRHASRSFEATPEAFVKLDEEELRDVVLSHLNSHFEGEAAGERVRKKGKTDICIEHKNRAAFVAECKLWKGPKALSEAIDQLLSYLTWRDTKAAVLVWNKTVKDFARLQESIPNLLTGHCRFARSSDSGHAGEWRAVFTATGDDAREITVHVFVVDIGGKSDK